MIEKFGQLTSEKFAEEISSCRKISQEISNFGINDKQRLYLIYLLSLELESATHIQEISTMIKELAPEIFLSKG